MNQKILFAVILSLFNGFSSALVAEENQVTANIFAVYDLKGAITESGQTTNNLLGLDFNNERSLTFADIAMSISAASTDPKVKGIILEVDEASMGLAQIEEMRRLLINARTAGKEVHCYTEDLTNGLALLGSAATNFTLLPEGNVSFTGLSSDGMYLGGMFEKIGITVDVIHIGEYKAAGETLSRRAPSKQARQQDAQLLDGLFRTLVRGVAQGRKLEPAQVKALINEGAISPDHALAAGLVDHLAYRIDFIQKLRDENPGATFDNNYQLPNLAGPEINNLFDLIKVMSSAGKDRRLSKDHIVIVAMDGAIDSNSIQTPRTEILRAARDEKAKGLVLRVNSPGGSALSSDVLWKATEEFRATGKPFVVSMGGVAASGGYYISAGADKIFAESGTITGSIGVVGMKVAVGDALARLGIEFHGQKRGRFADTMNLSRPLTAAETELIRRSMLDVYGTFKQRVSDGRGDKIQCDLESIAGGRVFTGKDAKKLGLVDEIGGLADAVRYVQEAIQNPRIPAILLPEPVSPIEQIMKKKDEANPNGEFITTDTSTDPSLAKKVIDHLGGGVLRLLSPAQQRSLDHSLRLLEAARSQNVLLVSPVPSLSW